MWCPSRRPLAAFLGLVGAASGCDSPTPPTDRGPKAASIAIGNLPPGYIRAGDTRVLSATVKDSGGNTLARKVTWSATGDASIDSTGALTAIRKGEANVSACADGVCATTRVYVRNRVTSIALGAGSISMIAGSLLPVKVKLLDAAGDPVYLWPAQPVWESSNPLVASVDTAGNIHAVAVGTAALTVEADSVTAALPDGIAYCPASSAALVPGQP